MSSTCERRPRVAVVVSGWPRVSEVFAQNEIAALHRAGMLAGVWATKPGEPGPAPALGARARGTGRLLPTGDADAQAARLAHELAGTGVTGVHGYFAHQPTAVAARRGRPLRPAVRVQRARAGRPQVSASRSWRPGRARPRWWWRCNEDVATHLGPQVRPHLVRHGVDLDRFPTNPTAAPHRPAATARGGPAGAEEGLRRAARRGGPARARRRAARGRHRPARGRAARPGPAGRPRGPRAPARPAHPRRAPRLYAAERRRGGAVRGRRLRRPGRAAERACSRRWPSARPVVATGVAAVPAAVTDEVTGLLVPPRTRSRWPARCGAAGTTVGGAGSAGAAAQVRAEDGVRPVEPVLASSAELLERSVWLTSGSRTCSRATRACSELFIASEVYRLEQLGVPARGCSCSSRRTRPTSTRW